MALVALAGALTMPSTSTGDNNMAEQRRRLGVMIAATVLPTLLLAPLRTQAGPGEQAASAAQQPAHHDGAHDFDFLIGDWKAHVRRLPDRLNDSNVWVEYDGISNHKKILGSNSNFEEFEVTSTDKKLHIKAQTLRLY